MKVTFLIFCWSRCSCSVRKNFWMPDQNGDSSDLDVLFLLFELTKTGGLNQMYFMYLDVVCVYICVCVFECV